MKLKLGSKYEVRVSEDDTVSIEITKLGIEHVTFMVSGSAVTDPTEPRVMPIGAFARWLKWAINER